jgi:hypothetical protein
MFRKDEGGFWFACILWKYHVNAIPDIRRAKQLQLDRACGSRLATEE